MLLHLVARWGGGHRASVENQPGHASSFRCLCDRIACALKPLNGLSSSTSSKGARLGSSLSPCATLSMRSTGLGILPIGSVGILIDAGSANTMLLVGPMLTPGTIA